MFSCIIFPTIILSTALLALAAGPVPLEPNPGQIETTTCDITWTPDSSGTWKTMYIELMTGDNFNMVHLTTVTTVDGTTAGPGQYSYPCPSVTPNSAIYFYQFSSPASPNHTWTGRFAIANAAGTTVPPSNAIQPDGEAIPWGTGALTDPNSAVAAPGSSSSSSAPLSTSSTSASSSAVFSTTSGATVAFSSVLSPNLATPSSNSPAATASAINPGASAVIGSSTNSGNTLVLGAVSARAVQAGVALAVIAGTFTFIV